MDKMTKIDIIARPERLEDLKEALNTIGVQGMTVSQVYGCGLQKGQGRNRSLPSSRRCGYGSGSQGLANR